MTDLPRHWRPLIKLRPDEMYRRREIVLETMRHYGVDEVTATKMLDDEDAKCEVWVNDIYQVQVAPTGPDGKMLHINIRRRDGGANLRDWRHFQQIKNEIAGDEREAFEVYPAESRKVDSSNKWHLWVLPEGTRFDAIGWTVRDVSYDENRNVPGMRQRKL